MAVAATSSPYGISKWLGKFECRKATRMQRYSNCSAAAHRHMNICDQDSNASGIHQEAAPTR